MNALKGNSTLNMLEDSVCVMLTLSVHVQEPQTEKKWTVLV